MWFHYAILVTAIYVLVKLGEVIEIYVYHTRTNILDTHFTLHYDETTGTVYDNLLQRDAEDMSKCMYAIICLTLTTLLPLINSWKKTRR